MVDKLRDNEGRGMKRKEKCENNNNKKLLRLFNM